MKTGNGPFDSRRTKPAPNQAESIVSPDSAMASRPARRHVSGGDPRDERYITNRAHADGPGDGTASARHLRHRSHREADDYDKATHTRPSRRTRRPRRISVAADNVSPVAPGAETVDAPAPRPRHSADRARREVGTMTDRPVAEGRLARIAARKRARRRARFFCGCSVALMCAGLVFFAPQCAISAVDIEGGMTLPADVDNEVTDSLVGQNFVRVNWDRAWNDLAQMPSVRAASARYTWTWPPHVVVAVEPRRAFARVGAGANWWVVDESGVPFRRATESDRDLYAVTGPALDPQLGQVIEAKYWSPVVQFAGVMSNDTQSGERWNLRRVYFDAAGAASLRLTGGSSDETLIQLGADEWPQKLKTARWALADFASTGKHAATLNLISKTVTTWTPRAVSASEVTDSARADEPATGREG